MKHYNVIYDLIKDIKNPVGVEIGVMRGAFSIFMLENKKDLKLRCVDPYVVAGFKMYCYEGGGRQHTFEEQKEFDVIYEQTKKDLLKFGDRSILIKMTSVEASKLIDDRSLDFVFIDGCHLYESVKQDITVWTPKVKLGGIVSGHDYNLNNKDFAGVCKAVNESFNDLNTGSDTTWWTIKEQI